MKKIYPDVEVLYAVLNSNTLDDAANKLNISVQTINNRIKKLKLDNKIKREGNKLVILDKDLSESVDNLCNKTRVEENTNESIVNNHFGNQKKESHYIGGNVEDFNKKLKNSGVNIEVYKGKEYITDELKYRIESVLNLVNKDDSNELKEAYKNVVHRLIEQYIKL